MKAKVFILVVGLIAGLAGMAEMSRGQAPTLDSETSAMFDSVVVKSLLSLIEELQNDIDRQVAGKRPIFKNGQIDARLKMLGRPLRVQLNNSKLQGDLYRYEAYAYHENGSSEWTLKVSRETGQITSYTFVVLPPAAAAPSPPVLFSSDPRVVEFLFASTRKPMAAANANISYSGERSTLTYGAASVRIPEDHKIGHIELPSNLKLFGITLSNNAPDEREHFIIKSVISLSDEKFDEIVRTKNAKSALVFVHGFNTTFEDALYRNAQIVWDLQYTGLSVLFTWASRGDVTDYVYDLASAAQARDDFIVLLRKLKHHGIEQVNVLAHSMGNLIALDALAGYASTSNPVQIAHLIMAAPDVDRDQFVKFAPKAKAITANMTLYASSADRALVLSRKLAGGIPRAGDVPGEGPIILPYIDTIDVTAVGDEIFGLNHNVFAASRDVIEDIAALLSVNRPPPRLIQIRAAPDPPAIPTYWKYVK